MDSKSETVPRSAIRVFLHIENRLLREALVRLFRKRADLLVVGQSEDGQSLSTEVMHANCDVFVISFDSGLVTSKLETKALADAGVKVLLISMDANEVQFLAAVRSGVKGCLLKDASASEVVDAIRSLYSGEAVCPRQFCLSLFRFCRPIAG